MEGQQLILKTGADFPALGRDGFSALGRIKTAKQG